MRRLIASELMIVSMRKPINFSDLNKDQRLRLLFNQLHEHTTNQCEIERRGLAQKLNDQVIQSLLALHIQLSSQMSHAEAPQPVAYADSLAEIADLVEELKGMARELRPFEIDTLDVVDILEQECAAFSNEAQIPITFAAADVPPLPEHIALPLFRLLQAALSNVAEHAQASRAWVNLWVTEREAVLKVEDDGQGLEAVGKIVDLVEAPGLRLFDLMLRFQHAGGYLTLQSHPDEGTRVTAVLPLQPAP